MTLHSRRLRLEIWSSFQTFPGIWNNKDVHLILIILRIPTGTSSWNTILMVSNIQDIGFLNHVDCKAWNVYTHLLMIYLCLKLPHLSMQYRSHRPMEKCASLNYVHRWTIRICHSLARKQRTALITMSFFKISYWWIKPGYISANLSSPHCSKKTFSAGKNSFYYRKYEGKFNWIEASHRKLFFGKILSCGLVASLDSSALISGGGFFVDVIVALILYI